LTGPLSRSYSRFMGTDAHRLTIIGDIGVDLVLGPLSGWPRVGTETILERSELRAGGSAGNAALAVSYLGGASRLLSGVGNDDLGSWLSEQFRGMGASLEVCDAATTLTVGGAMLGNCAMGSVGIQTAPARIMSRAQTVENTGR